MQLTPLQFYYSLQTESQRAAAVAAVTATVVKETAEERSSECGPLSGCRRDDIHASRGRFASQSSLKRRRLLAGVDSKVAETGSGGTASSKKRKQALSKAGRHRLAEPRHRDTGITGDTSTVRDAKEDSAAPDGDDEQKCDSGSVSTLGETERTVAAASEKDGCGDDGKTGCSDKAADTACQPGQDAGKNTASPECRRDEDNRECEESLTSKSLPPASSTSTPAAVSKLKIFKCSESKKLCVRSADVVEPSVEQSVPPTSAVPKLSVPKNLVIRRSGLPVGVQLRKNGDDKRERRRHRRRRRDQAKTVVDPKTVVARTPTITDVDAVLSPDPDATEDAAVDRPTEALADQQVSSAASSPLSSNDNVVSSSTSSRLLPDDEDDDDVDPAHRAVPKSRTRRMPGDNDDGDDEEKPVDQAAASGVVDGSGDSATTLRVPIRLGGESGQTGELLLRLPQNVSVQCSFRADQILIASSPATTSTEQSTLSTGAGVARTASSDADLLASQQHVSSDALITELLCYFRRFV